MDCEICGKSGANKKAEIEGTILNVCDSCVNLGEEKTISNSKRKQKKKPKTSIPESDKHLKSNYSEIVRKAREDLELKRKDLAKQMNLKSSVISKIERGELKPSLKLSKKLERELEISLITEINSRKFKSKNKKEKLTIGDVAEIK